MRKIFAVFLTEWIYIVRDRISLLMLILMPIIFTLILGVVFGGAGNTSLRIGIVDGDPAMTTALTNALTKEEGLALTHLDRASAENGIRRGVLDAVVLVPPVEAAESIRIMTDASAQRGYDAYTRIMGVQSAVSGSATAVSLAEKLLPPGTDAGMAGALYSKTPLALVQVDRAWKRVAEGVLQVSPGMLVMFILMFAAYAGEGIVYERLNGTWRRLTAAPVSGWQYLIGRLTGKVSAGMVQFVLLAAFGAAVFRVDWGSVPGLMLLTGLIFSLTCAAFGLFLGVVCRTPEQLNAIATTTCLALAALGGAWWPIEASPALMQSLGRMLPTGQAMHAFHSLILYGSEGVADARTAWLGLLGWGLLFLVLGAGFFRAGWKSKQASRRPQAAS